MSGHAHTTAAMIVIGNEILSGKVADSNSPYLARALREAGVSLERVIVIPDDVPTIASTVAEYAARYALVFTSGGAGPTHDDMTIAGIAGIAPNAKRPLAELGIRSLLAGAMAALMTAAVYQGSSMF